MSTSTMSEVKSDRPADPTTFASATVVVNPSYLDEAAVQIHLALGGESTEQPAEDVLDAVRESVRNVRVRRAPRVSTENMADQYRVMVHPEEYCHPAWCLARVEVDEETGRPWHNTGVHRRGVRSMEVGYGLLIQVGVGVADDFELDLDDPFVHVWQADLDHNGDSAEELQLTADEADWLGDFLKAAASRLRSTTARIAETTACEAADAFIAEKFPQSPLRTVGVPDEHDHDR